MAGTPTSSQPEGQRPQAPAGQQHHQPHDPPYPMGHHLHQLADSRPSLQQDVTDEKSYFPPLDTSHGLRPDSAAFDNDMLSPSNQRADASRLNDDLELLRAERAISNQDNEARSKIRSRTRNSEPEDTFNTPDVLQETGQKRDTNAVLYKFWIFLLKFPRILRYMVYILPGAALLLIPVLLGYFKFNNGENAVGGTGGTYVMWFGIWLEIVWGSLWVSRMITSLIPHLFRLGANLGGSTNPNKWKDIGAQIELHSALFLWMLACLISFKPTCDGHRAEVPPGGDDSSANKWIDIVNKVIIALFVLATLNFVEKIVIQWIANTFHQRTYATRIENNKGDVLQLVALFEYAKMLLETTDSFWQRSNQGSFSGAQTPMQVFQDNARQVLGKVGYVAGRVGNDLIGRKVTISHPQKIVTELLRSQQSSHTLARLIYRSLVREGQENVFLEDMQNVFKSQEEAEAAFGVFDKDLNGDISMDEFEAVCNEIHLEKKAIAASLKDLDSVVQKLDKVFLFIIVVIAIVVFISILSGSAAAGLASAGTSVLGLAWMLQATAQEFLQSIIFVFVKHPFDVGDRVTIYGSTGAMMTGDDYYVTEISLLYTEFKKMEGHIVQAPNSILNTLFILNQRRSNGLADVVPLEMRFGTPAWQIEELKTRMLDFCLQNKRDYKSQIISEMTQIQGLRSCTMNIIFFHKTSFQNELLRLTRHNKFVTELMEQMVSIGIQAPLRSDPGGSREHPLYWVGTAPPTSGTQMENSQPREPESSLRRNPSVTSAHNVARRPSISVSRPSDAIIGEPVGDFQDVFDSRREHIQRQRLASIREKDVAAQVEQESEPRASASGLAPIVSQGSGSVKQRSSIFGRGRSKTQSQQDQQQQQPHPHPHPLQQQQQHQQGGDIV